MANYDFFDLTKIVFDPPEKSGEDIDKKIETAIEALESVYNDASRPKPERNICKDKIDSLRRKQCQILVTENIKRKLNNDEYDKLVDDRVRKALDEAQAIITARKQGNTTITSKAIESVKKEVGLNSKKYEDDIGKLFVDSGFTIKKLDPSKKPKFLGNINLKSIHAQFDSLRKEEDTLELKNANLVFDMYDFTAYLEGKPQDVLGYRRDKSEDNRKKLYKLLDDKSREFARESNSLKNLCYKLAAAGKTDVFFSKDTQDTYDMYLKYISPELTELFSQMKKLNEQQICNEKIAEGYIKKITAVFGDKETAVFIYNNEHPALKRDPYIPSDFGFMISCPYCQSLNEFTDEAEAKRVNKCGKCPKALYEQCKKCKQLVLVSVLRSADRCPECGFVFKTDELLNKNMLKANIALSDSNFDEALRYVSEAELYVDDAELTDSGKKLQINLLRQKINEEKIKYEKPLLELRQLISTKQFMAASEKLRQIAVSFPKLNTNTYENSIRTTLTKVQGEYNAIKTKNPVEKVNGCYTLLDVCVDYKPAIEILKTTPVLMPQNVRMAKDSKNGVITISWAQSPEFGITYRVIRKTGKNLPQNAHDGEILKDNITTTLFIDNAPLIAQEYSYAVCAGRFGVFSSTRVEVYSSASAKSVVFLPDVTNINYEQRSDSIRISWKNPKNSIGTTVMRTDKKIALSNNVQGYFDDKNLDFGKAYEYIIKANYQGGQYSDGVNLIVTLSEEIEPFKISVSKEEGDNYRISWDIVNNSAIVRILVNDVVIKEVGSSMNGCTIQLEANSDFSIRAAASSSNSWVNSINTEKVSTVQLQVYVEWRFLNNPFSKMKTVRVTMDSTKEKRMMTRSIHMFFCAYNKKVRILPSEKHKDAVVIKEIFEEQLQEPKCVYSFNFDIDPKDYKFEGKSLKEWNFSLFCLDDEYKCNHPVQRS